MTKTVVGLIDEPNEAQNAIEDLLTSGFDRKHIGVISTELLTEAQSAITGATAGMWIGGAAGLLLAAAAIAIPGIGPVLVAGPAATLLASTLVGSLAGGLIGGLIKRGVPEDEAHFYAEGVRRGGTLITVNTEDDEQAARAVEIMKRHGAVDMSERVAEWKQQGWSGRFEGREQAAQAAEAKSDDSAKRDVPTRQTASEPVEAQRMRESAQSRGGPQPEVALSAVQVYDFVIELPVEDATVSGRAGRSSAPSGRAADQTKYVGAERRKVNRSFAGSERRQAG